MRLQTYQRSLLQAIKRREPLTAPDPYLLGLQADGSLDRIRQIATWWRRQQFSRYCPLTYRALVQLDRADTDINAFYESQAVSPYVEQAAPAFLRFIETRYDGLIKSISQFEQAVIDTQTQQCTYREVDWTVDPHPILNYLIAEQPADLSAVDRGSYKTRHYANEPVSYDIIRLTAH